MQVCLLMLMLLSKVRMRAFCATFFPDSQLGESIGGYSRGFSNCSGTQLTRVSSHPYLLYLDVRCERNKETFTIHFEAIPN